jgi:eukaryotic-like serine/threonine-protein kinase
MGEVYKARDTRLARDVAIKVLPATYATDAERLARFEREARAAAALSHPNVVSVYDVGVHDGAPWLVMELLEGQTLRDILGSGAALSERRALEIAVQVAKALSSAHSASIVHRDLKPENIFVTPDEHVKVLDFGIAKFAETIPSASATAMGTAAPITEAGVILGTVAYMAPEQARGLPADHRSDIFAFGVVLYEMLAGERPFQGSHAADVLADILKVEPKPLSGRGVSATLQQIVQRCLSKSPAARFQSAADLVFALEVLGPVANEPDTLEGARRSNLPSSTGLLVAAGSAVVASVITGLLMLGFAQPSSTPVALTSAIAIDGLLGLGTPPGEFALSPDGKWLAYSQRTGEQAPELVVRSLSSGASRRLRGTRGAVYPFWSPDSARIGFYPWLAATAESPQIDLDLKSVALEGGSLQTIASLADAPHGQPSWHANGTILAATGVPAVIQRVPASGGVPEAVTRIDASEGETEHLSPFWLPDGEHFLFAAIGKPGAPNMPRGIYVGAVGSTERTLLIAGGTNPHYAAGYLLFTEGPSLLAQRFDPTTRELTGKTVRIAETVAQGNYDGAPTGHVAGVSVSGDGRTLLYAEGTNAVKTRIAWLSRSGSILGSLADDAAHKDVFLSPDATRASATIYGVNSDIWIYDVARTVRSRLTFAPSYEEGGVWSPDGNRVAMSVVSDSGNPRLVERRVDGRGDDVVLLDDATLKNPVDWSRDGRVLFYERSKFPAQPSTPVEIWAYAFADKKTYPVIQGPFDALAARLSPDERYLAYVSNESGRFEVYAVAFPSAGAKIRISTGGATLPLWRRDGRELFYRGVDNTLTAVAVSTRNGQLIVGDAKALFKTPMNMFASHPYDVMPDGERFMVNTGMIADGSTVLTLVANWNVLSEPR